jgi:hypothetical protein
MDKYAKLYIVTVGGLCAFLFFMLYQNLKLTEGGFTSSSEVSKTLPLIIQADISLIAFWGITLTFKVRELSATRIELIKNLWEIGFKRDELKMKIAEAEEDEKKKELLMKLHEELGKDAATRKEAIEAFYKWEISTMFTGLLAIAFFIASVSCGLYGISMTFHTELIDSFTYFTPIVLLFTGVMLTVFTLMGSFYKLEKSLEIR